jgi:hypothetical protein
MTLSHHLIRHISMSFLASLVLVAIACGNQKDNNKVAVSGTPPGKASNGSNGSTVANTQVLSEQAMQNPGSPGVGLGGAHDTLAQDLYKEFQSYPAEVQVANKALAESLETIDFNYDDSDPGHPVMSVETKISGRSSFELHEEIVTTPGSSTNLVGAVSSVPVATAKVESGPQYPNQASKPTMSGSSESDGVANSQAAGGANQATASNLLASATYKCLDTNFDGKSSCERARLNLKTQTSQPAVDGKSAPKTQDATALIILRHTDVKVNYQKAPAPDSPSADYKNLVSWLSDKNLIKFATLDSAEVIGGTTFVRLTLGLDKGGGKIAVIGFSGNVTSKVLDKVAAPQITDNLKFDIRDQTLKLERDSSGERITEEQVDRSYKDIIVSAAVMEVNHRSELKIMANLGADKEPMVLDFEQIFKNQDVQNANPSSKPKPNAGPHKPRIPNQK